MEDNSGLISYCGLYCGACSSFKKGSCQGCARNERARWCKVRKCNINLGFRSCADCKEFPNINDCQKINSKAAKIFGMVFNTDRRRGIAFIRSEGYPLYAQNMIAIDRVCLKRRG